MTKIIIHPNAFQEYLDSEEGKQVRKIFFDGENYEFLPGMLHCSEDREKVDSQHYFYIYVTTKKIQQDLQKMNSMPSIIESIEALQERIQKLEQIPSSGSSSTSTSLKGVVTIEPDENGSMGLEIPGLMSINNYKLGYSPNNILPTEGNLCLLVQDAEVLRINPRNNMVTSSSSSHMISLYIDKKKLDYYTFVDQNHKDYEYQASIDHGYLAPKYAVQLILVLRDVPIESDYFTFDTIFKCHLYNQPQLLLNSIAGDLKVLTLNYLDMDSSSIFITVPKTVNSLNVHYFNGVIDVHECNSRFLLDNLYIAGDCESATMIISNEQYLIVKDYIENSIFRHTRNDLRPIHVRIFGDEDHE